ncbi:MAG: hypothetical protein QXW47_10010 [Candidatus Jordarchaeales archaeon]
MSIEVEESILDRKSHFNVKRFRLGSLRIERPVKVLDVKVLNARNLIEMFIENRILSSPVIILEHSNLMRAKSVRRVLFERDDDVIKKLFGFRKWMQSYPRIFSITFTFNPFTVFNTIEDMSGFFEYQHAFSDPVLLVPNVKIDRYEPANNEKTIIMKIDEYLRFVKEAYEILNYRNRKPIFVPVSLKFGINEIIRLAREYSKREFFYVWFDFEGSAIIEPKIARIRAFLREFENIERINDIIVFSTNIRREIISNPKSERTPSSDVLAPLVGSNLIGVNKEPPRPIELSLIKEKKENELREHKARVFDAQSYYYLKVTASNYDDKLRREMLDNPRFNILFNSKLLDSEFTVQTQHFLEEGTIERYVSDKRMIREYREGALLRNLFPKERTITDWF